MRDVLTDSLINHYPLSPLPSNKGNQFKGTQLIKQQFLPTLTVKRYSVGLLAVSVEFYL
jgi:hypothetical protein